MLSTLLSDAPRWQSQHDALAKTLSAAWRDWLFDRGSLTERLVALSDGNFRVAVLREDWRSPTPDERDALHMRARQYALVREVTLLCHDRPVVYARSVLPASTLTGEHRYLKNLGNKPLGAALFKSPTLERDPLVIARINELKPVPHITKHNPAYARRSLFYLGGKPLLVSEIFLPVLIKNAAAND